MRLTIVERSETARGTCAATLAAHALRVHETRADLPTGITGIVFANELLDAMPVHVVVMTASGLAEVYVDERDGRFVERLGPPSVDALSQYFTNLGLVLESGARADVNLAAMAWIRQAAACLTRGYLVLIDYGHDARVALFVSPRDRHAPNRSIVTSPTQPVPTNRGRHPGWSRPAHET